ncbi:hypothetical protein MSAS_00050 [Mycobacterium saskatchewanense]|uniref:AMP-binding enzyme n=1 Tax=Mycobacterium saskatchewanense TaxID=220927 RepID=UPI00138C6D3D|nr:AMP-binding protein [Mycobacterium saskatchewanense]BBX60831.1 hypothetical protein MSAS_00050 [Mycobacterium saskatchewanense]
MSGYLNRAEATAETITEDDWVRTGDVGRLDADGYVYIEDRLKDMIITGGENVYGPEVESVLIEHPAVADAAVIGVPDDFWGESVKAIVVATAEVEAKDVIEFCRRHLAAYKCPRTVDFVASLPATRVARSSKPHCGNRIGENAGGRCRRDSGPGRTRAQQCDRDAGQHGLDSSRARSRGITTMSLIMIWAACTRMRASVTVQPGCGCRARCTHSSMRCAALAL